MQLPELLPGVTFVILLSIGAVYALRNIDTDL
jgi:hypothetical protein